MGRAKNTLKRADVSSTPVKLRYLNTLDKACLEGTGISVKLGENIPYSVNMSSSSLELMTNYRMIRQVYYQQAISASVLNSASFWDPFWVSTAASGSNDTTDYYFPTEENASILILAIPSALFGEQVERTSFSLRSSDFYIYDDGDGNLVDSDGIHVGNIFYAQGIAIITNEDYVLPYDYLATEDGYVYETENDLDVILEVQQSVFNYLATEGDTECDTEIFETENDLDIILQ